MLGFPDVGEALPPYRHVARTVGRDHPAAVYILFEPRRRQRRPVALAQASQIGRAHRQRACRRSHSIRVLSVTRGTVAQVVGSTHRDAVRVGYGRCAQDETKAKDAGQEPLYKAASRKRWRLHGAILRHRLLLRIAIPTRRRWARSARSRHVLFSRAAQRDRPRLVDGVALNNQRAGLQARRVGAEDDSDLASATLA